MNCDCGLPLRCMNCDPAIGFDLVDMRNEVRREEQQAQRAALDAALAGESAALERVAELEAEVAKLRHPRWLEEALNSGDGTYKP